MAVNVDTVYQKVLALANKEQRGYITPQDFNLFADQAQKEIFEQYFFDLNQARRVQGNDTVIADIDDILEEKISYFEVNNTEAQTAAYNNASNGGKILPSHVFKVLRVVRTNSASGARECELLGNRDFSNCKLAPLTKPSKEFPVANVMGNVLRCNVGNASDIAPSNLSYIIKPSAPNWTYAVVNRKAMYNANNNTNHFELHAGEEVQLVNKILKLAGLAIQQPDVMKAGVGMESLMSKQQSKI